MKACGLVFRAWLRLTMLNVRPVGLGFRVGSTETLLGGRWDVLSRRRHRAAMLTTTSHLLAGS